MKANGPTDTTTGKFCLYIMLELIIYAKVFQGEEEPITPVNCFSCNLGNQTSLALEFKCVYKHTAVSQFMCNILYKVD